MTAPDPALPADRLQEIRGHVTARRGDRRNPHQGDCTGTRCPGCDCCMHCTSIDGACPECAGCRDTECQCQPPAAPDAPTELERLRATVARVEALAEEWECPPWYHKHDDPADPAVSHAANCHGCSKAARLRSALVGEA